MTAAVGNSESYVGAGLPQAEQKRIRDLLIGVGKVYPLNGWRSVDWLGYCLDPHGQIHHCGAVLIERLAPNNEVPEPQAQGSDIPNWNYRLHNQQ